MFRICNRVLRICIRVFRIGNRWFRICNRWSNIGKVLVKYWWSTICNRWWLRIGKHCGSRIGSLLTILGPDYMKSFSPGRNFSPSCRCLAHVVKALLKINYDYMGKSFSPDSRGEVPAQSRQAGIPPNRAENFSCNRIQPG